MAILVFLHCVSFCMCYLLAVCLIVRIVNFWLFRQVRLPTLLQCHPPPPPLCSCPIRPCPPLSPWKCHPLKSFAAFFVSNCRSFWPPHTLKPLYKLLTCGVSQLLVSFSRLIKSIELFEWLLSNNYLTDWSRLTLVWFKKYIFNSR